MKIGVNAYSDLPGCHWISTWVNFQWKRKTANGMNDTSNSKIHFYIKIWVLEIDNHLQFVSPFIFIHCSHSSIKPYRLSHDQSHNFLSYQLFHTSLSPHQPFLPFLLNHREIEKIVARISNWFNLIPFWQFPFDSVTAIHQYLMFAGGWWWCGILCACVT